MNRKALILLIIFTIFLTSSFSKSEDDVNKAKNLIDRLKITNGETKSTNWIENTKEKIKNALAEKDYDTALELCDKILNKQPTNEDVIELKRQAKRDRFWDEYGDKFILLLIIITVLPWIMKFFSKLKEAKPKKLPLIQKYKKLVIAGKYKQAISGFNSLLAKGNVMDFFTMKEMSDIYFNIGKCYFHLNKLADAAKALIESIKFDNNNITAHNLLVKCFLKQKASHERAIQEYQSYYRKNPTDVEITTILANYFVQKGLATDDAMLAYRRYLKLDPNNKDIIKLITARFIRKKESTKEAIQIYEKYLEIFPMKNEVRRELANILFSYKEFEKCIKSCKILFEKGYMEDEELHKIMVESHKKLGKYDELSDFYENFSASHPESIFLKEFAEKVLRKGKDDQFAERIVGNSEKDDNSSNFMICPHCAHLNPKDSEFCLGCGKLIKE